MTIGSICQTNEPGLIVGRTDGSWRYQDWVMHDEAICIMLLCRCSSQTRAYFGLVFVLVGRLVLVLVLAPLLCHRRSNKCFKRRGEIVSARVRNVTHVNNIVL